MVLDLLRAKCMSMFITQAQCCRRLVVMDESVEIEIGLGPDSFLLQTNSIASIAMLEIGSNFLPGQLKVTARFGSGFLGNFSTFTNGSIQR